MFRIKDFFFRNSALRMTAVFFAVFLFLFAVSNHDFSGTSARSRKRFDLLESVGAIRAEYHGISPYWLERYGISLREESDIRLDGDGDGLSLVEEYRYLTNPLDPDSDGDGYSDGTEVGNGYSPTGMGRLDMNRNGLSDKWEEENGLPTERDAGAEDPDSDGLPNADEYAHGTDPATADSDGDGFDDAREIRNGYDPSVEGDVRPSVEIIIERIGVVAPVVLSGNPDEVALQKDLERGIIRYPGTANPGQRGNAFLTGHSSNYAWAEGGYNRILSRLDEVVEGDGIVLRVVQGNGKTLEYGYLVTKTFVASPDDPRLSEETDVPVVTLATCWPLNTSWKRFVIRAELAS